MSRAEHQECLRLIFISETSWERREVSRSEAIDGGSTTWVTDAKMTLTPGKGGPFLTELAKGLLIAADPFL